MDEWVDLDYLRTQYFKLINLITKIENKTGKMIYFAILKQFCSKPQDFINNNNNVNKIKIRKKPTIII